MTRTASPARPLVISVSLPALRISTTSGSPEAFIVAFTPSAIDRTATKTSTTPAMPMTATAEEPSRAGMERMLTPVTAMICDSISFSSVSPKGVDDPQAAGLPRGQEPGADPQRQHQADAGHDGRRREVERRQQPVRRIAAQGDEGVRQAETQEAADTGDERRFEQDHPGNAALAESERLQHGQLVDPLADRLRHRVARDEQDGEHRHGDDPHHDRADVADLLGPIGYEGLLRIC